MNLTKPLNITKIFSSQQRNGKASRAIPALRKIGYTMPEIRNGLIKMHKVSIRQLSEGPGAPGLHILYKTAQSARKGNLAAQDALAKALGCSREELFPPGD